MKFRKKPIVIDAVQFDGTNIAEIWQAFGAEGIYGPTEKNEYCKVVTLEGVMKAWPGWWIIQGVNGELYPCDPDVFAKTYEEVKEHIQVHYAPTTTATTTNVVYLPVYPPMGMRA